MRKKRTLFSQQIAEEEPLLNLTPLIDVVFVVLIIFILIAPLLEMDTVQLASSYTTDEKQPKTPETSPITVYVRADNTVWAEQKQIALEELPSFFLRQKQKYPDKAPQVFHDKKASFGTYQTIKNAVELAGFESLDVILQPGSP